MFWREGKWDPDDDACIITCDGKKESTASGVVDTCGGRQAGDGNCEQACGASWQCDESAPNSFYDTNGDGFVELYCSSDCIAKYCSSATECQSAGDRKCQYYWEGATGRWWWSFPVESDENGSPAGECKDGYDNDCDGKRDSADPGCAGVTYCQVDADCPALNNRKGVCKDYTCDWPACRSNDDCVDRACCVDDPSGPRPRTGICVTKGVYSGNTKYLCDPGEWVECNKDNEGLEQKIDGITYTCSYSDGSFKWITSVVEPTSINPIVIVIAVTSLALLFYRKNILKIFS